MSETPAGSSAIPEEVGDAGGAVITPVAPRRAIERFRLAVPALLVGGGLAGILLASVSAWQNFAEEAEPDEFETAIGVVFGEPAPLRTASTSAVPLPLPHFSESASEELPILPTWRDVSAVEESSFPPLPIPDREDASELVAILPSAATDGVANPVWLVGTIEEIDDSQTPVSNRPLTVPPLR